LVTTIVLVVEDQAPIRLNAIEMLGEASYTTVEASNADDAIKILKRVTM
jgi:CheY-like chemotaxis protein